MRCFSLLYSICIINYVQSLEPFDPWSTTDRICKPSMDSCHFELRARSTMSMFYKQLYRVVAASDGTLHKFDNASEVFSPEQIITADGYPKLVSQAYCRSISPGYASRFGFRFMFSIILYLDP